jgi:hypothetical protein
MKIDYYIKVSIQDLTKHSVCCSKPPKYFRHLLQQAAARKVVYVDAPLSPAPWEFEANSAPHTCHHHTTTTNNQQCL